MQTLRTRWPWIGGAAVVVVPAALIVSKTVLRAQPATAATQTGQVSRGDIQSQVISSAALQPAADVQLTFGSAGTMTTLNVQPGQSVEQGQVIASLDPSDLQLAVTQAQANLVSAQAKLDSVKAGSTSKDIANGGDAVKSAQAKLDALKQGPTASDLANAQAALQSAQAKLANVKAGSTATDVANAQSALKSAQAKLDTVKAGSTATDVANAKSALKSAQAKLADLKAGNRAEAIAAAQANLVSAQAQLAALPDAPTDANKSAAAQKATQSQATHT